jgi:hypothetical protein
MTDLPPADSTVPPEFRLSDAERAAGLAHVAALRARLTGEQPPLPRHSAAVDPDAQF